MKKYIFIAAILFAAISANAQNVESISDAEFATLLEQTKTADEKVRTTAPKIYESGKRAFHITAGASYGKEVCGTIGFGYQVGKNGRFKFGTRVEKGNRLSVDFYAEHYLGSYHTESRIIPAFKLGVGASEQDMWCGRTTDPNASQGVWLGLACPRMAFSAIAEFDLKWKPAKKEPRFYIEVYGGYRLTPSWGNEMSVNFNENGNRVYDLTSPLKKKFGYFYVGIGCGWALYRNK